MKRLLFLWISGGLILIMVLFLSLGLRQWLLSKVALTRPPIGAMLTVEASAYAPSPYQTDATPCITAVGTRVRKGVVAANFLPIGTIFSIDKDLYIVEDRMNSRYRSGYIDIWFPSTKEALAFGRQDLKIKIVDYGTPGQSLAVENDDQVVQPGAVERMNLRFTAYANLLTNSLRAAVSGKNADVNCSETL